MKKIFAYLAAALFVVALCSGLARSYPQTGLDVTCTTVLTDNTSDGFVSTGTITTEAVAVTTLTVTGNGTVAGTLGVTGTITAGGLSTTGTGTIGNVSATTLSVTTGTVTTLGATDGAITNLTTSGTGTIGNVSATTLSATTGTATTLGSTTGTITSLTSTTAIVTDLTVTGFHFPGIHGELYVTDSSATVSVPTGTTYTKITAWGAAGVVSGTTTSVTGGTITLTTAGTYEVVGNFSFSGDATGATFYGALFYDGTEYSRCHFERKLSATGDVGAASFGCFLTSAASKDIDFRVRHESGGSEIFGLHYMNLRARWIGN